jgi:hypothetical protein
MMKKSEVSPAANAPLANNAAGQTPKPDLGLAERRKLIRPLPAPEAVESEGDTDWALFQALSGNEPDPEK